jgi:branched-chain amino acid transport system ATP-binding protein
MLEIFNLNTGYDKKQVIYDLTLKVDDNEIVAIVGPNGSGKSTLLKSIMGVVPLWRGDIILNGRSIINTPISTNIKLGLTFCPQGNRVFSDLTVRENLEIGGFLLSKQLLKNRMEFVLDVFPILKDRIKQDGGNLSGGERQILALARALIPDTKMLLLDEPSLGLAPNLLKDVFAKLVEINNKFKISILIVEQKVMDVLSISQRVYGLKLGKIAFSGKSEELKSSKEELKKLFL